jgi:predicted signal transduction protein with EAL and GGDEF domain
VARWGGDEFIAVLKNADDLAKIREVIQKIVESIEQPFHINNRTFYLKTSIGISLYPQDGTDQDTLLKHADAALYRSKVENIAEETSRELAIISVIMMLAHKLNLAVICEGVETQKELDILLSTLPNIQKFHVQGYFYSKPLSVEDATNFLHNHYQS